MKNILKCIGAFFITIAALWVLLILTSLIPNGKIRTNMFGSAEQYNGADPFYQSAGRNSVTDNYADVILLNVLWNIKSDDAFVSSLDTKYYDGDDGVMDRGENYGLFSAVFEDTPPNTDYSRYWHGSVIFIRPLMLLGDVRVVKLAGIIFTLLFLIIDCIMLIKRRQSFAAAALVISFLAVQMYNIRLSLEYMPTVLICLGMLPFFVCLEKRGDVPLSVLSVICGTMTAFFDFLTTETLTILIPLIIIMMGRKNEGRFEGFKRELVTSAKCGVSWVCAYLCTFLVKWTAASIVTGENKFIAAISSAEVRVNGEAEELSPVMQMIFAPLANISAMFGGYERVSPANIIAGLFITVTLSAGIFFIFRRGEKGSGKGFAWLMLVLGFVPYLRYIVLNNHSYLHEFFTYRAQAASVLALMGAVWFYTFGAPLPEKKGRKVRRK
ncbi:hypothetical protein [Huintestinicola sp.]